MSGDPQFRAEHCHAREPYRESDLNRAFGDAKKQAGNVAGEVQDAAADLYGQARDSAAQVADATTTAARKTAGSFERALRNTIETQPYTAVVIALGIGWLFGRMHRPDSENCAQCAALPICATWRGSFLVVVQVTPKDPPTRAEPYKTAICAVAVIRICDRSWYRKSGCRADMTKTALNGSPRRMM